MEITSEFKNLWFTLPEFIIQAHNDSIIWNKLFSLLKDLDIKAQWIEQKDNMRIKMIQNAIKEWLQELESWIYKDQVLNDKILNLAIINRIELIMTMEIWDEWWKYEEDWFNHSEHKESYIEYYPLNIPKNFWVLRRWEMYFTDQSWIQTIGSQPFIERSNEPKSTEFAKEYYNYCCNPSDYPWSKIRQANIWFQEWFPITPDVLQHMEKKLWVSFSELKICKFFNTEYKDHIMPTHGLLCHMFLMCSSATVPFYLAWWHLWDPNTHDHQFEYYSQFLIHNDKHVIPNRQWFIKLLKILITLLKSKKEHGSRLCRQEISVDELFPLMKWQGIWPFELYEDLIREQFCLVDNITTWDTIWFKLTGTGMMFLYMCCPNIY